MNIELRFPHSILRWDEALPLGNGQMGCLVWGKPEELRFSLDRADLWDRTVPYELNKDEFCYSHLKKLAGEGNTQEIRRIFDAPYSFPTPTRLPAGKLLLRIHGAAGVESRLQLAQAQGELAVSCADGSEVRVSAFVHAGQKAGLLRIGAEPERFSLCLQRPAFGTKKRKKEHKFDPETRGISQGGLRDLLYEEAESGRQELEEGAWLEWFSQKVGEEGYAYGIVMAVRRLEGETQAVFRIVTSDDGPDWLEEGKADVAAKAVLGYGELFLSHKAWWAAYWKKSGLSVPDPLFQKQWYLANYLFASTSRKGGYPMSLQGVWTADDGELPPWKGDYHNDLNTQLSYTHFYKANHLEEGECFQDFLWSRREEAENFARTFYQTEGICLPGVMTIDGKPLGGWPMYSLSPTNQIWLCQTFGEYFRYTGDLDFLRDRAYPYFRQTARCILGLLRTGEDGLWYLPVSSSPEIHDDEAGAWVKPNSNYDLALLHYLFGSLAQFAGLLGLEEEAEWKAAAEKLPDFALDEKKVLLIAPGEKLQESHRHLSNAMSVWPLRLHRYESVQEREIIDAVIGEYERLGTGMWVGFTFCWMAQLYAVQRNGEGAASRLEVFWKHFCGPNGFHLNGDFHGRGYSSFHYRPFTLEANMCAADALQEMLFQMAEGRIRLFPAVPEAWKKKVSFRKFRGEGGLLVSARMRDGRVEWLELTAGKDCSVTVLDWEGEDGEKGELKLRLKEGQTRVIRR